MSLQAEPSPDGSEFILNGEKLWCTNGVKAGVLVVMARTPPKMVGGKERKQITAFIVDVDTPGLEITYRCRFMGLSALQNLAMPFTLSIDPVPPPFTNSSWATSERAVTISARRSSSCASAAFSRPRTSRPSFETR